MRACPTISCAPLQGGAIVVDIKPDELIDAKDRLNFAGTVQYSAGRGPRRTLKQSIVMAQTYPLIGPDPTTARLSPHSTDGCAVAPAIHECSPSTRRGEGDTAAVPPLAGRIGWY